MANYTPEYTSADLSPAIFNMIIVMVLTVSLFASLIVIFWLVGKARKSIKF